MGTAPVRQPSTVTSIDFTHMEGMPFHSAISNNSGLLIQSNCTRTEYLCGPLRVRLTVEESNPTQSDHFF